MLIRVPLSAYFFM